MIKYIFLLFFLSPLLMFGQKDKNLPSADVIKLWSDLNSEKVVVGIDVIADVKDKYNKYLTLRYPIV